MEEKLSRIVEMDGKYNLAGADGTLLCDTWWDGIGEFHEGWARVRNSEGMYNFIGEDGALLSEKWFDEALDFSEGFAVVSLSETFSRMHGGLLRRYEVSKSSFLDSRGNLLPSGKGWDNAGSFSGGVAPVQTGWIWTYIDRNFNPITVKPLRRLTPFFGDFACVMSEDGKWNFLRRDGSFLCEKWWDDVTPFSEGKAGVKRDEKWNYVDLHGKFIGESWWKEVSFFIEGKAVVKGDDDSLSVIGPDSMSAGVDPASCPGAFVQQKDFPLSALEDATIDKTLIPHFQAALVKEYFITNANQDNAVSKVLNAAFDPISECFMPPLFEGEMRASDVAQALENLGVMGIREISPGIVWVPLQNASYTIMDGVFGIPSVVVGASVGAYSLIMMSASDASAMLLYADSLVPRARERIARHQRKVLMREIRKETSRQADQRSFSQCAPLVESLLMKSGYSGFHLLKEKKGCIGVEVRVSDSRFVKLFLRYHAFQADLEKLIPTVQDMEKVAQGLDGSFSVEGISSRLATERFAKQG